MIHLRRMLKSFSYALRGVGLVFASEQSFRIQTIAAIAAIILAIVFDVTTTEWVLLLLLIGAVLALEIVNSILERLVDAFKPRLHPVVRDVKDAMAGAVLIVSLIAAAIGATIFLPHVLVLLSKSG